MPYKDRDNLLSHCTSTKASRVSVGLHICRRLKSESCIPFCDTVMIHMNNHHAIHKTLTFPSSSYSSEHSDSYKIKFDQTQAYEGKVGN